MAVVQARMSSKRFPGKVLQPIWGIPMLLFEVNRIQESQQIDHIIVATSTDKTDNIIWELCIRHKIWCFRGDLNDVLDRYHSVTQIFNPAHVVRLTADCPLIDPEVIDKTILHHLQGGYDYTWNPGFPDGLDVEVMTFNTLHKCWKDATSPEDREHVCTYIKAHPEIFKIGRYENGVDLSHIKISVDTPEDYEKIKALVEDSVRVVRGLC